MPTYGYQCKACGHQFEVFQKITDPAITDCEQCGSAVKKMIYPVGIQFKGSGFYINDYARASAPKENGAEPAKTEAKTDAPKTETTAASESAPAPAKTEPAKTESAPAAK